MWWLQEKESAQMQIQSLLTRAEEIIFLLRVIICLALKNYLLTDLVPKLEWCLLIGAS